MEDLGRKSGFIQRKSKLTAYQFLNILLFAHKPGKQTSLLDFTGDLYDEFGVHLTKQSLQDRFNEKAVCLLKEVLSCLLNQHVSSRFEEGLFKSFNRVRIKDSTKFALPEAYAGQYQGYGGVTHNSSSMISIQHEYDLLSGKTMDLRLTSGLCNDQGDSRDYTQDVVENDLFVRDLGYCTIDYMTRLSEQNAYFLNRLAPKTKIYHAGEPNKELDINSCLKKLKKHQLPHLEYQVLIGKKAKLPTRLIISAVDKRTYERRLRKTGKQARSYGHRTSDEFRSRAKVNIFITNTDAADLPTEKVQPVYSLRWQIELIFKVWKSQANINALKEVKIHRFECQLLGQIIWLLLHWKLYSWLNHHIASSNKNILCSPWKYYKRVYRLSAKFRLLTVFKEPPSEFVRVLAEIPINQLFLEKKKGKQSHIYDLLTLN